MKNKIIISLLSLCALLYLTSCEKKGEEMFLPGANLSISLRVDGPSMTKTSGSSAEALESEYNISSLDICLISTSSLGAESAVLTISSNDQTPSGQPIMAWKLTSAGEYGVNAIIPKGYTGEYLLYVIANKPSWMSISKYGDICGAPLTVTDKEKLADCWSEGRFLMVNKQDEITTSGTDQAGVTISLDGTSKVSTSLTIERVATKIRVKKNPYMEVAPLLTEVLCSGDNVGDPDTKGAIAAMSLEGYALFNCVNSFNLIQRWSDQTPATEAPHLLVSPSSYAGVAEDHSDAYDMEAGYYDNVPGSLVFQALDTPFYCLENNSPYYAALVSSSGDASDGTKMKGRVTGLVFKAKAGYVKSYSGTATVGENLVVEEHPVDWTKGTGNDSSDIIYGTLYQYKGNYYGDIACLLRNNSAIVTTLTESLGRELNTDEPTIEQLRTVGVKVYEGGIMYYNYWIEDRNYTDNGKHYLSVMRNTFYDINITAINSLGDEFPCGGDSYNKSAPISVDVPKLVVSMDIPDWTEKQGDYTITE